MEDPNGNNWTSTDIAGSKSKCHKCLDHDVTDPLPAEAVSWRIEENSEPDDDDVAYTNPEYLCRWCMKKARKDDNCYVRELV